MGRDRDPALVVDRLDRPAQALERRHATLEEQAEQVAAAGRDLLAHDDLDGQAAVERDVARGLRRVDPLVVRDRHDVERAGRRRARRGCRRPTPCRPTPACGRGGRRGRGPAPRRSRGGRRRCRGAGPPSSSRQRRGRARSGGTRPTTARARRRRSPRTPRRSTACRRSSRSRRGPVRRGRDEDEAARVAAHAGPPGGRGVDRGAGLEGEERGPGGDGRRVAEQRHRQAAAGQVAVRDEADRLAAPDGARRAPVGRRGSG